MQPKKFAEDTTIHGIKNLLTAPRKWQAIAWGLVILAAACYGAKVCTSVVQRHLAEPTSSKTTSRPFRKFPDLVYCPNAWINVTKAHQLGYDDAMIAVAFSAVWGIDPSQQYIQYIMKYSVSHASALERLMALNKTVVEFFMDIAYHRQDVIRAVQFYPYGKETNYTVTAQPRVSGICYSVRIHHSIPTILAPFASVKIFTLENTPLFPDISPYDSNYWQVGYADVTMRMGVQLLAPGQDAIFKVQAIAGKLVSTKNFECDNYTVLKFSKCVMERVQPVCASFSKKIPFDPNFDQKFAEIDLVTSLATCASPYATGKEYYGVLRKTLLCKKPCQATRFTTSLLPVNDTSNPYPGTVAVAFKLQNSLIPVTLQHRKYSLTTTASQMGGVLGFWTGTSFVSVVQLICFVLSRGRRNRPE